jgi:transposase-like protein
MGVSWHTHHTTRNGFYKKSVKTTTGKVDLDIPRDRDGSFEPKAVPKYEGVSSKPEEQIISMFKTANIGT